jgi:hypothetical protein
MSDNPFVPWHPSRCCLYMKAVLPVRKAFPIREASSHRGQVAVEWLMVAGILTAVAIFLSMMFRPVLIDMVRLLARAIRTPGL